MSGTSPPSAVQCSSQKTAFVFYVLFISAVEKKKRRLWWLIEESDAAEISGVLLSLNFADNIGELKINEIEQSRDLKNKI